MLNFLFRRLLASIFVLIGVSFLVFFIARVIPGDPARIALGPMATEEQVQQLREELHLNDSFVSQYFRFIQNTVKGDLGQSLYTSQPVISDIADYLPATLELVFVAGLFMILLGIPLGVLGAKYEDSLLDHIIRIVSLVGVAIPSFVWAVLLMLIFSYGLDLFPISGQINEELEFEPITGFIFLDAVLLKNYDLFFSGVHHIILPSLALGASGIGQISRITRSNMIETYKKDYIKVTKIFHFNSFKVAFLYALRPSMIPVLTILGLDFAAMIGNAFLVEAVFNWPGFGNYTVEAIMNKDLNAIVATCILISAFFLVVNMIIDLMVAYVNPKIRLQGDI